MIKVYHNDTLVNDFINNIGDIPFIDVNSDYSLKVSTFNITFKWSYTSLQLEDRIDVYKDTTLFFTGMVHEINKNHNSLTFETKIVSYLYLLSQFTLNTENVKKPIMEQYGTALTGNLLQLTGLGINQSVLQCTTALTTGDYICFTSIENNEEGAKIPLYCVMYIQGALATNLYMIGYTGLEADRYNNTDLTTSETTFLKLDASNLRVNYYTGVNNNNLVDIRLSYLLKNIFTSNGLTLETDLIDEIEYNSGTFTRTFENLYIDELFLISNGTLGWFESYMKNRSHIKALDLLSQLASKLNFYIITKDTKTFSLIPIPSDTYTYSGLVFDKVEEKRFKINDNVMIEHYGNDFPDYINRATPFRLRAKLYAQYKDTDFTVDTRTIGNEEARINMPIFLYISNFDNATGLQFGNFLFDYLINNDTNYNTTYPFLALDNEILSQINDRNSLTIETDSTLEIKRCYENYLTIFNKSKIRS